MSNLVVSKYRTIQPLNDEPMVNQMLEILIHIPNERQESMWIRDEGAGNLCLFKHENFPGKVIEYVQGSQDDSVTTLYEEHAVFSSLRALLDARKDMIAEVGRVLMTLPSCVAFLDRGRERKVTLKEMGTAQLIDILAMISSTDLATA